LIQLEYLTDKDPQSVSRVEPGMSTEHIYIF